MNTNIRALVSLAIICSFSTAAWGQDEGLRIYISADMEGVVGVVTGEQLGPGGFEYERFREFMTAEVNATIEAARAAGATEFLISDSHGNGQNLLIDKLPDDVTVIRSWPRSLTMMAGVAEKFDGVIFLGYHASTANMRGVRAHTGRCRYAVPGGVGGFPITDHLISCNPIGSFSNQFVIR